MDGMTSFAPRYLDLDQPFMVPRPDGMRLMGLVGTSNADANVLQAAGAFWNKDGWSVDLDQVKSLKPLEQYLPNKARPEFVPHVVDLIPSTSWFSSLANLLAPGAWHRIRKEVIERDVSCRECGSRWSLEVHELWDYSQPNGVQTLTGFELLCSRCHETRHLGLASVRGRFEQVFQRLAMLNRLGESELAPYHRAVIDLYELRSSRNWTLNLELVHGRALKLANSVKREPSGRLVGRKGSTWVIGVEVVPDGAGLMLF